MSGTLRLEGVTKHFGETTAVADLSLEVRPGEFLTLLGPSGCGKTTTLRMIAGFESPSSGRILLDDKEITRLPPQRRGFGMVFQNYALFPHLDVFENVAFGVKGRGTPRAEVARRVEEALALVDLEGYGKRKVQQLSGGQQQRVALARALAPEPRILLLDEPLSNLDAALRERTRAELRALLERLEITAIFVTHDQEEAFELSDRIAIMQGGRLQQVGTPEGLYLQPANHFVATFLGRANFLEGRVVEVEREVLEGELSGEELSGGEPREGESLEGALLEEGSYEGSHEGEIPAEIGPTWLICELPGGARWRVRLDDPAHTAEPGDVVRIMVRPEALQLLPPDDVHLTDALPADERPADLHATILERHFAGPATLYRVRVAETELNVLGRAGDGRPGDTVRIRLLADADPLVISTATWPYATV